MLCVSSPVYLFLKTLLTSIYIQTTYAYDTGTNAIITPSYGGATAGAGAAGGVRDVSCLEPQVLFYLPIFFLFSLTCFIVTQPPTTTDTAAVAIAAGIASLTTTGATVMATFQSP
jgi:hypothetical protein